MTQEKLATRSASNRVVTVTIPHDIGFDLKKIQKIQEDLVARLGHQGCYSGFDILFRLESDFIVNPKSQQIEAIGG